MPCTGPSKEVSDREGVVIFNKLLEILREHEIYDDFFSRNPLVDMEMKRHRVLLRELKEKIQEIVFSQRCRDF